MTTVEHKAVEIVIPADLWEEELAAEAMLTAWLVADGSSVEEAAIIAEIMVDKVTVEVEAPASGRLEILIAPESFVDLGDVIGRVYLKEAAA